MIETASAGQINFADKASTNLGVTQALSGGTLTLSTLPLTNTGGTLQAKAGGTVNFIANSTITNGSLQSEAGGVLRMRSSNDSSPGGGLTLNAVTVSNAGTFTNEMSYTKNANNASTYAVTTTLASGTSFTNALNAITTVANSGTQGAFTPTGPHDSTIGLQSGATFTNLGTLNVRNTATRTSVSSQQSTFSVANGATFTTTGTINVIADSIATGATASFTSAQSVTNGGTVRIKGNANSQWAMFSVTGVGNDYTQSGAGLQRTILEQGGALSAADRVDIQAGTLGGVGSVTGATTIGRDAILAAGETFAGAAGAGVLTFNQTLTLGNDSEIRLGLGTDMVSSGHVTLAGASNLILGSNLSLTLIDLTGGNWVAGAQYRLFDLGTGSISGSLSNFTLSLPMGWAGTLSSGIGGTDYLDLTLSAVPEPSSHFLLIGALVLGWRLRRRIRPPSF